MTFALRRRLAAPLIALAALLAPLSARAMGEDNAVYRFTRVEAGVGRAEGDRVQRLEAEGWVGQDYHRLWWEVEAEGAGGDVDHAELQLQYGRYVAPFWDAQVGVRHDVKPHSETYLVAGMRGVAPYKVEVHAAAFLDTEGRLSARAEAEYDLLVTQKLVAKPFTELNLSASAVPERRLASGLTDVEAGVQVRYEVTRKIAPYVTVSRKKLLGGTADLARADGDATHEDMAFAGIRLIF